MKANQPLLNFTQALCAAALLAAPAVLGQSITNPSFEADVFGVPPGLISANTAITGWTAGDNTKAGLNPAGGANPIANNGIVPNGTNVAFIQTTNYLSTVISGLTIDANYTVKFRVNSQNATTPSLRVALDGGPTLFDAGSVVSVGAGAVYKYVSLNFKATATAHTLYITNDATAATAVLLVDDFSVAASTSGWSISPWSNDATVDVDSSKNFTHAYAFNVSGAPFLINGVPFTRIAGGGPVVAYDFNSVNVGSVAAEGANAIKTAAGGSSSNMAHGFVFGGNPAFFTLNNLVPGKEYVANFYSVGWDVAGKAYGRSVHWMAGNDHLSVNQDHYGNDQGIRVSYRYIAPANGSLTISNLPYSTAVGTFHTYGMANYEVAPQNDPVIGVQPANKLSIPGGGAGFFVTAGGARPLFYQWLKNGSPIANQTNRTLNLTNLAAADLANYSVRVSNSFNVVVSSAASLAFDTAQIPNPSFEADSFFTWPGYIAGSFPISGWTTPNNARAGLTMIGSPSPFANNGAVPDGTQVAFLQNSGGLSNWVSTVISGLTPAQTYTLSFSVNSRQGQKPNLHISVDGVSVSDILLSSVGGTNPFKRVYFDFTPAGATAVLNLTNNAAGDTTALLDDFEIAPSITAWSIAPWNDDASSGVDGTKFYTHAFNFGSVATDTTINGILFRGIAGANPSLPGQFFTAGFPSVFAGPDANVLTIAGGGSGPMAQQFIYGGAVQSITLSNLLPGMEYVMDIYAVGFDPRGYGRAATFSRGTDTQTFNQDHYGNDAGIRFSHRYVADGSGVATFSYQATDAASTIHTYGFANYAAIDSAPVIAAQPQNAFVSIGSTQTIAVSLSAGTQPTYYQWQLNGVDIMDATNATLVLDNLNAFGTNGYSVVITNSLGSVTSSVAIVEIGAPHLELFNTGVSDARAFLEGGIVDSHYQLVSSPDPLFPGPDAVTMHNGAFPLLSNYFTNGLYSSWISPRTNSSPGNTNGLYIYRTHFIIDTMDPANSQISGRWASDNEGVAILLNGVPTGISNMVSAAFTAFYPFSITSGFVAGSNVIDFVISNGPATGPTALRAELAGVGRPLAPVAPQFVSVPANVMTPENTDAQFVALATGSGPLSYQWYFFGFPLPDETNRVLRLLNVAYDQAGDYSVTVSNSEGSTNAAATLIVNAPPIAGDDGASGLENQPIHLALAKLLNNDSDPDFDTVTISAVSATSTNGGSVLLTPTNVIYTPVNGFTGIDRFTYTAADGVGGFDIAIVEVFVTNGNLPGSNLVSIATVPGGYQVRFAGVPGRSYDIERATDILGPWIVLQTVIAPLHGIIEFTDTTPPPVSAYYRTAVTPQ